MFCVFSVDKLADFGVGSLFWFDQKKVVATSSGGSGWPRCSFYHDPALNSKSLTGRRKNLAQSFQKADPTFFHYPKDGPTLAQVQVAVFGVLLS